MMERINASELDFRALNEAIREKNGSVCLEGVLGQRFIAAGLGDKEITVEGTPGNALGAYLNGAEITVRGNAQDAVGDTMNEGRIVIHGNIGDAAGYAMRGGEIYVRGNAGYRAGIHMKEYRGKRPVMVIGGYAGSFLGEYQAGGLIVVLGLGDSCSGVGNSRRGGGHDIVGNFPCTGMHGGMMFLRGDVSRIHFPHTVIASPADDDDLAVIEGYLETFCSLFGSDRSEIMDSHFTKIVPDTKNPYKQMYVAN